MSIADIHTFLAEDLSRVEAHIDAALRSDIHLVDSTNRSLREHPGKMLRPMLSLLMAAALGKVNETSYRYAAATELLHNATLLHDDVVDGAAERRGMPTVSSLLGGSAAVLIGDFWLVRCLDLILDAEVAPERVLRLFSNTLGHLSQGELLQMELAGKGSTTEADYLRIIYGKTASLFVTAALSAAISVEAPEPLCRAAETFAAKLGTAFQIKDDILDYLPDAALGKPVGLDLREQKITQPLLSALESVPQQEAAAIREKVAGIGDHPEWEADVRAFVAAQDGVARAKEVMNRCLEEALESLEAFPPSPAKAHLTALTRYFGDRQH